MKTKFEISSYILDDGDLESCFEYYEKHYKKDGFIFDEENQEVYIIFDEKFDFNEGDRIELFNTFGIIAWKSTNIANRVITYVLDYE